MIEVDVKLQKIFADGKAIIGIQYFSLCFAADGERELSFERVQMDESGKARSEFGEVWTQRVTLDSKKFEMI